MKLLPCILAIILASFCVDTILAAVLVAEVSVVADNTLIERYVNEQPTNLSPSVRRENAVKIFRKELDFTFVQVNNLLSSLSSNGVDIEVRYKSVELLSIDIFPSNSLSNSKLILDGSAKAYFTNWANIQNIKSDFKLLLTGYDLVGSGSGVYSQAITNIGKMCDPLDAVSVVEYNGTAVTPLVITNQVIYLLGGSLDGLAAQTIMAPLLRPTLTKRWECSNCTAVDILEYLPLIRNCLEDTDPNSIKPTVNYDEFTNTLLNLDFNCKRARSDTRSYACKAQSLYGNTQAKGDAICKFYYCSVTGTHTCNAEYTPDMTVCDEKKVCIKGKCQPNNSPASALVDPNCVLGDQKEIELIGSSPFIGKCEDLIAQKGKLFCYIPDVEKLCCTSCKQNKVALAEPGCEYGDKNVQCATLPLTTSCAPQNRAICCKTCQGYVAKRSVGFDSVAALSSSLESVGHVQFNANNLAREVR